MTLFVFNLALAKSTQELTKTTRACVNRFGTVTVLQQDTHGVDRILVQKGDAAPISYTACKRSDDASFSLFQCQGPDSSGSIKLKINKETLGATLTTTVFFSKNFELSCQDAT